MLFDKQAVAEACLEEQAAVGLAVKFDGETAAKPFACRGAQDKVRQRRVELAQDFLGDVIRERHVGRARYWCSGLVRDGPEPGR